MMLSTLRVIMKECSMTVRGNWSGRQRAQGILLAFLLSALLISVVISILIRTTSAVASIDPAPCPAWALTSTPNDGGGENVLYGVSALSTDSVWAVGYSISGQIHKTLVM